MFFSTFSIVAHDAATGSYGIAVASKFLAVGAYVPYCRIGAGAVATQAHVNMAYGPDGLALMAQGLTADECVQRLIANDAGRDERQFGVVDAQGNAATYTGTKCMDWAGGQVGKGYAVQGNILAGANVISAMALAYENTSGEFADRLFAALKAADEAGGDRRGRQSAALLVLRPKAGYGGNNDRYLDLRVDDHRHPVAEMGRLLALHQLYFGVTPASDKLPLDSVLLRELQQVMQRQNYYHGPSHGQYDAPTRAAWRAFTGTENLEARVDLDAATIDPPALAYIRERFSV